METGNRNWEWRLGMQTGNADWERRLGIETGSGDWEWRLGMEAGEWKLGMIQPTYIIRISWPASHCQDEVLSGKLGLMGAHTCG